MGMYSSQHASAAKCYKIDFRLVCKTAHAKVLSKMGDGPPFDIYIAIRGACSQDANFGAAILLSGKNHLSQHWGMIGNAGFKLNFTKA